MRNHSFCSAQISIPSSFVRDMYKFVIFVVASQAPVLTYVLELALIPSVSCTYCISLGAYMQHYHPCFPKPVSLRLGDTIDVARSMT